MEALLTNTTSLSGGIQSLDWNGGLDQWTGTVDSPKSFPDGIPIVCVI